jgi:hypothetical protein
MPGTIKQLIQNYLNKNVVQVSANMEQWEIKESITSIL